MTELAEWSDKDDEKLGASLLNFVKKYQKYTEKTFTGDHRKAAQFWLSYCKLG